jgi:hypothetical protein
VFGQADECVGFGWLLMPRKRRDCQPGLPVHVAPCGNNRQVGFAEDAGLKVYANANALKILFD